jgi:hypothetical protein
LKGVPVVVFEAFELSEPAFWDERLGVLEVGSGVEG